MNVLKYGESGVRRINSESADTTISAEKRGRQPIDKRIKALNLVNKQHIVTQ